MSEPFVIEGKLVLMCQEGGFACDAWYLEGEGPDTFTEQLYSLITNFKVGHVRLDNCVASHFNAERDDKMGHRIIGNVRITIERLEDETS